jgi:hypothetical protein
MRWACPPWPARHWVRRFYFDLIVAASSARFFCQASYSGVPRRGGASFGIPPSHVGTLSATAPLTAGLGSVAQAESIMQAMATSAGLVALNFINFPFRRNWKMPNLQSCMPNFPIPAAG